MKECGIYWGFHKRKKYLNFICEIRIQKEMRQEVAFLGRKKKKKAAAFSCGVGTSILGSEHCSSSDSLGIWESVSTDSMSWKQTLPTLGGCP